jgi:hypothetical protein
MSTRKQRLRKERRRAWANKLLHRPHSEWAPHLAAPPPGLRKMSDMLEELVEPYMDSCDSDESYQMLFTLGMIGWSLATLPEARRQSMLDKSLAEFSTDQRHHALTLLKQLVERKQQLFPDDLRMILNFDLRFTSSGMRLNVMSALPPSDVNNEPGVVK